jgi:hypothetical protein
MSSENAGDSSAMGFVYARNAKLVIAILLPERSSVKA